MMNAPKNVLLVTPGDLALIRHWPAELRALFDPQAARELAEREAQAERERAARLAALGDERPF